MKKWVTDFKKIKIFFSLLLFPATSSYQNNSAACLVIIKKKTEKELNSAVLQDYAATFYI